MKVSESLTFPFSQQINSLDQRKNIMKIDTRELTSPSKKRRRSSPLINSDQRSILFQEHFWLFGYEAELQLTMRFSSGLLIIVAIVIIKTTNVQTNDNDERKARRHVVQ